MRRFLVCRGTIGFLLIFVCLCVIAAQAQSDDPGALNTRATGLFGASKFAEAITLAERFAEIMKSRYGAQSAPYAAALNNLAGPYQSRCGTPPSATRNRIGPMKRGLDVRV